MTLEWSDDALADLDRFAAFLHQHHPSLARIVAREIVDKAQILSDHPQLGRPVAGRDEYRQVVLRVLNAAYVFQYRYDGKRLMMLRVFHGRERRE
jgi:plasmid stabilization system protein ParE